MGIRSWLYGPAVLARSPELEMRHLAPLTLNIDDVRDMDAKLRQYFTDVDLWTASTSGGGGSTRRSHQSLDELLAFPAWDRQTMTWETSGQEQVVDQQFSSQALTISISTEATSAILVRSVEFESVANQALDALTLGATRHVAPRHIRRAALAATPTLLVGAFVWLAWNYHSLRVLPLLLLLAVAVIPVGQQAWRKTETWYRRFWTKYTRTRLEMVSRADVEERRRNAKRDRKVVIVVTLPLLVLGAFLNGLFRLWIS